MYLLGYLSTPVQRAQYGQTQSGSSVAGEAAQPWPLPMLGAQNRLREGGGHLSRVAGSIGRGQGGQDDTPQAHSYIVIVLYAGSTQ